MTLNELITTTANEKGLKVVKCVKFNRWIQYAICDDYDIFATFQVSEEKKENKLRIAHINTKEQTLNTMERIIEVFQLMEDGYQYVTK